ncbi:D-alanine--D-alanine ligase family protein [Micromonospora sp. WMMD710]|uniref:D-alanine--D-alanine ligase family protein n=1 Tax=Micromonospora sp. WMMD710 TaxID=3016085 RepID=UPI0024175736|nr:D-alanine--D-alanine ligase family protein [Micromonospora sp. WMMD710]MDG4757541.1 D-alanine--D-alanine ligase [Micromonospora sp. WMMD710]
MTTRLAVLYGGQSGEHEVSRQSAASILAALDRDRYQVTEVLIGRDGGWYLDGRPTALPQALRVLRTQDVVFPALHGPYGEDGTVASLLEWLGVPYVGNGVFASAAGMDKGVTKRLLAVEGLRVSPGVTLRPGEDLAPADRRRLQLPVFVKPARAGSSLGVVKVDDWAGITAALEQARQVDPKVLVEQGARGREIDVAVLQYPDGRVQAGPPLEIRVTGAGFFDYDAKYDGGAVFQIPAPLDAATTEVLQDRAIRAFHALDCRGLLRVDFFLPEHGSREPIVNEVNTFPGFTAASQFPQIWQQAGIGFAALLDILIAGALADQGQARSGSLPRSARAVDPVGGAVAVR